MDGIPAGGSSLGRQQQPSGVARRNPAEDRGISAHSSTAGVVPREVAQLEPNQPEQALIEDYEGPVGLLPVDERDLEVEPFTDHNPGGVR